MTSVPIRLVRSALLPVLLVVAAQAQAAGGHFAVDDAEVLDEGRCKLEGWITRSPGDSRLLHLGPACRVGPVELGATGEYERQSPGSTTGWSLTGKWATEVGAGLRVGASLEAAWQGRARPRYQDTTAKALLTWEATEALRLHANVGRAIVRGPGDERLGGIAADWSFSERWTAIAERYRQEGGHFARVGVRWRPATDWNVDLSRAQHLSGSGASSWTVGLTREFARP